MLTAVVGILLAAPVAAQVSGPTLLVGGAGNQTAPSMSGGYLAFLDDAANVGGAPDLFVKDVTTGLPVSRITNGGGVIGGPDAALNFISYRRSGSVELFDASKLKALDSIPAPGTGRTALSESIVAWEEDAGGDPDVGWRRLPATATPVVLKLPGTQRAVAVSAHWLAYLDDRATGAVHLVDTLSGADSVLFAGAPLSVGTLLDVAVWSADANTAPLVAVMVSGANGVEIAVLDQAGVELKRLTLRGEKRNPHFIGDWIGFEDLSTGTSKVVLWNRIQDSFLFPSASAGAQVLHDLVSADTVLRVVWAEQGPIDFDIFLFETQLSPPPPPPSPGAVKCTDAAAVVLADFTVVRPQRGTHHDDHDDGCDGHHDDGHHDDGHHDDGHHDDGHHDDGGSHGGRGHSHHRGHVSAGGALFAADVATPVLVCIEANGVTSGWVAAGSQVVASPADLAGGAASLEGRLLIAAGDGRVGAVISGAPGASLRVRVLADPGGSGNGSDGSTCLGRGDCPPLPGKHGRATTFGCGSAGEAGTLGLLLVAGLFAIGRVGRRSRR